MAVTEEQTPALGEHGEPCQECGAPLVSDQRYCLNCGKRRAGPRVDYRRLMGAVEEPSAEAQPSPATPSPPAESKKAERDYAPLAAVGGIAVLGLMLLVGVLIGKGNNSTTSAPATIVKYGSETGGNASTDKAEKTQTTANPNNSKKSKESGTGAKNLPGGLTGNPNSKATVQATPEDLEKLNGKSGEDYENEIKKLPDKFATPGKAPPIDKTKPPGGGGSAETFE